MELIMKKKVTFYKIEQYGLDQWSDIRRESGL